MQKQNDANFFVDLKKKSTSNQILMESIVDAIYRNKVLQKRLRSSSIINSKFQNSRKRLPIFNCKELCLCNNSTGNLYMFISLLVLNGALANCPAVVTTVMIYHVDLT